MPPQEAKLLLPAFHPTWAPQKFDFTQDLIGSSPFNPIILHVLNLALKRRRRCEAFRGRSTISAATGEPTSQRGGCSVFGLGPLTYFEACTKFLVGRPLARNPNAAALGILLKQLHSLAPMVATYNETLPFNTMTFRPTLTHVVFGVAMTKGDAWQASAIKGCEASKDALYRASNLPDSSLKRKKNIDLAGPGMGGPSAWINLGAARRKGMATMFKQQRAVDVRAVVSGAGVLPAVRLAARSSHLHYQRHRAVVP